MASTLSKIWTTIKYQYFVIFSLFRPPDIVVGGLSLPRFFVRSSSSIFCLFSSATLRARWTELNQNRPHAWKWVRFENAFRNLEYSLPLKIGGQKPPVFNAHKGQKWRKGAVIHSFWCKCIWCILHVKTVSKTPKERLWSFCYCCCKSVRLSVRPPHWCCKPSKVIEMYPIPGSAGAAARFEKCHGHHGYAVHPWHRPALRLSYTTAWCFIGR